MSRTAKDNRDLPHPRPVRKIELSDENAKKRLIAAVLFFLIGAGALVYTFVTFITPESGWQAIQASNSSGITCADEFVFLYELGGSGLSVSAENKAVVSLYTEAMRKAYQEFHTSESFDGLVNVFDINQHPNEVMEVDEMLYQAFSLVQKYGDRAIYLGPVYARYNDLFSCEDDVQLADFDPRLSEAVRLEYEEVAAYAADAQAIELRLLDNNQVCLYVSESYLDYAAREGIERFIDFSWMKNAFIADYVAQIMVENGYTHGSVSSFDGFSRNLDDRGISYSLNLFDRVDGIVCQAATMEYSGAMSIVCLRDFPINSSDHVHYYELRSGEIRTPYLDVRDGICKSAVASLTAYSKAQSCAEILLQVRPVYIADDLRRDAITALAAQGVDSVYCRDRTFYTTDLELVLTGLYEKDGIEYTLSLN